MNTLPLPESVAKNVQELGGMDEIFKTAIEEEKVTGLSEVFHAVSDPLRVKILYLLNITPLCVCLIKEALGISDSKLSYHLSTLKSAGLISDQRQKNFLIYRITAFGKKLLNLNPSIINPL